MKNLLIFTIFIVSFKTYAQLSPQGNVTIDKGEINLETTSVPSISLNFKNTGALADTLSLTGLNSNFKVSLNRCSNVAPNKTCQVTISPQRNLPVGLISFTFNGFSISMDLVRKDSNGDQIVEETSNMEFSPLTIADIQFLDTDRSKSQVISVKNVGKIANTPTLSWQSNPSGSKIIINRCSTSLAPSKTCSITVSFPKVSSDISQSLLLSYSGLSTPKSLVVNLKSPISNLASCSFGSNTYSSGSTIAGFTQSTVPYNQLCSSVAQSGLCNNGVINSVQPLVPSCEVLPPPVASLSLVSNFAYSETTGQPATCRVKEPFGQTDLMAELVVSGPFTSAEKEQIQNSACSYLQQSFGFSSYSFNQANQCHVNDFGLFFQVEMETGFSSFDLMNNVYFDFSPYNIVPLESANDCETYLNMGAPFEMFGGGINLTNGKPVFLTEFNSKLYFGIPSGQQDEYYLAENNNGTQIVSLDYLFLMDDAHPPIVFGNKLYLMGKNKNSSSFKIFYLDNQGVINEELMIPTSSTNSFVMVANSQYLLVNNNSDSSTLYKLDVNRNRTTINTPEAVGIGGQFVSGNFFGDSYYSFTYGNEGKWILLRTNLTNNTVSRVVYNSQPLQTTRILGKTNNEGLFWTYDLYTRNLYALNATGQVEISGNLGSQGSLVNIAQGVNSNIIYFSFVHTDTTIYKIEGSSTTVVASAQPAMNNFFAVGDDLIFGSENTREVYRIDSLGNKTTIAINTIMKSTLVNNVYSNLERYEKPSIFDNKIAVNTARSTSPGVFSTPYGLSFIDLSNFQISEPLSLCSNNLGLIDSSIEFNSYKLFDNKLFLGTRDCSTADEFELSKYSF